MKDARSVMVLGTWYRCVVQILIISRSAIEFDETPVGGGGRKSPWEAPGSKRRADNRRSPYDRYVPFIFKRNVQSFQDSLLIFTKILTNISSLLCRSVDFDETPVGEGRKSPWEPPGSKRPADIRRGSSPYDR